MEQITDIKERNKFFNDNEFDTWASRFVWRGLYGTEFYTSISIFKFFANNKGLLDMFKNIIDVDSLFKVTKKLAKKYVDWVKGLIPIDSDEKINDIHNFFIGSVGEFFFTYLLDDVKCLLSKSKTESGKYSENYFDYVAPRLPKEKDFGVDLTCIVNYKPCVVQVKFWNPYSPKILTNEIAQGCFADGVLNGFITPNDNVVICWLGDDRKISQHLRENKILYDKIIFIDNETLTLSVKNKKLSFWEKTFEKFTNFVENFS